MPEGKSEYPDDIIAAAQWAVMNHRIGVDFGAERKERLVNDIAHVLLSERQDDRWRTMDTAPKDGTVIDLWNRVSGARITDVRWVVEPRDGVAHQNCIMDGWKTSRDEPWGCLTPSQFSHWQPLPAPPSSTEER